MLLVAQCLKTFVSYILWRAFSLSLCLPLSPPPNLPFFFFLIFGCSRQENKSSSCYYIMAGSHGGSLLSTKFHVLIFALYLEVSTDTSTLSHFILSTLLRCRDYLKAQKNEKVTCWVTLQSSPGLLLVFSSIHIYIYI